MSPKERERQPPYNSSLVLTVTTYVIRWYSLRSDFIFRGYNSSLLSLLGTLITIVWLVWYKNHWTLAINNREQVAMSFSTNIVNDSHRFCNLLVPLFFFFTISPSQTTSAVTFCNMNESLMKTSSCLSSF